MKPGRKRSKKIKISRVKLQKQVLAAERRARTLDKYYLSKLDHKDQEHKEEILKLENSINQLKQDKDWMHKIILEYKDEKARLKNENKLLYQMLEKKPTIIDKIKQKLSKQGV